MSSEALATDGLKDLPKIDPARAELANALLVLLTGIAIEAEEGVLTSSARMIEDKGEAWLLGDSGASLRVPRWQNVKPVIHAERVEALLQLLDAAEPCLDAIEQRIGIPIEPTSIAPLSLQTALCLAIDWQDGANDTAHSLELAIDPAKVDALRLQHDADRLGGAAHQTPWLAEVALTVAHLELDEAAGLDPGDVLLVHAQAELRLFWHSGTIQGIYDCQTGKLVIDQGAGGVMDIGQNRGNFAVPVTMALPQKTFSADVLGKLQPGSTLHLGPLTEGLAVELSIGGRGIARGELVQIGNQFGVLIEERLDMRDAAAETPPAAGD